VLEQTQEKYEALCGSIAGLSLVVVQKLRQKKSFRQINTVTLE
jgi:hypothetical protein